MTARVSEIERERFFAKNVLCLRQRPLLPPGAWNLSGVAMTIASMSLALEHAFEAAERFSISSSAATLRARSSAAIRHCDQLRVGDEMPQIFGMAPPHFSNAQHSNS